MTMLTRSWVVGFFIFAFCVSFSAQAEDNGGAKGSATYVSGHGGAPKNSRAYVSRRGGDPKNSRAYVSRRGGDPKNSRAYVSRRGGDPKNSRAYVPGGGGDPKNSGAPAVGVAVGIGCDQNGNCSEAAQQPVPTGGNLVSGGVECDINGNCREVHSAQAQGAAVLGKKVPCEEDGLCGNPEKAPVSSGSRPVSAGAAR